MLIQVSETFLEGERPRNVPAAIYFKLDPREPLLLTPACRIQILCVLGQLGFSGGIQIMREFHPLKTRESLSGFRP